MRAKCLPLYLDRDTYARLEQQAAAQERDPLQQARWLLRQVLEPPLPPEFAPPTPQVRGTEAAQ